MKQLVRQLHSKKGQDRTLPASLWMRYKTVEQKTLSFAGMGFPLYVPKGRYPLAGRGQASSP